MAILRRESHNSTANGSLGSQIVLPIVLFLVMLAVAYWVTSWAEQRVQVVVGDQMVKLRGATQTGLLVWLESREGAALLAATSEGVKESCAEIASLDEAGTNPRVIHSSAAFARLRGALAGAAGHFGTGDFVIIRPDGMTMAASNPSLMGTPTPADRAQDAFAKALKKEAIVSRPFLSEYASQFVGKSERSVATMFVFAPIVDDRQELIAVLGLRLDPKGRLARVLQGARVGETGEAYLVDLDGNLLTPSRFESELVSFGMLKPGTSSVLGIKIQEPGCELLDGEIFDPTKSKEPTALVRGLRLGAQDPQFRLGLNVRGYGDYRGTKVVGAWSWLEKYGMGLAVEADHIEAFEALLFVRWVLLGAAVLLVLSLSAVSFGSVFFARLRRKMERTRQLGQYTLERKIGAGGMGQIYLARHALLKRPTALKVMESSTTSKEDRMRFEKEVQLTSQLSHPNTISIYDYGHTPDGVFYYVMEHLEGLDLQTLVNDFGACPPGRVVRILDQICASLEEAHEQGLIHRDVKPANIFLCERGGMPDVVKVLDFGLVKEMSEGSVAFTKNELLSGTPGYLAPEVIRQPKSADVQSDLYCVAAIGYFLLTGKPVFSGDTVMDVLDQHLHAQPQRPSEVLKSAIPLALEDLLMQCLSKNPDDRVQSATDFRTRLKHSGITWHERLAHAWWNVNRSTIVSKRNESLKSSARESEGALVTLEINERSWHQTM